MAAAWPDPLGMTIWIRSTEAKAEVLSSGQRSEVTVDHHSGLGVESEDELLVNAGQFQRRR